MAAVGFAGCSLPSYDRVLWALRTWLDSWPGIGHVGVGMHRQGFDLQLTQYDKRGWRATFYTTGMEHSPTSATGTAWERTPVARDAEGGVGGPQYARYGDERIAMIGHRTLFLMLLGIALCATPIDINAQAGTVNEIVIAPPVPAPRPPGHSDSLPTFYLRHIQGKIADAWRRPLLTRPVVVLFTIRSMDVSPICGSRQVPATPGTTI